MRTGRSAKPYGVQVNREHKLRDEIGGAGVSWEQGDEGEVACAAGR